MAYVGLVEGKRPILYWDEAEIHQITSDDAYSPSLYNGRIASLGTISPGT